MNVMYITGCSCAGKTTLARLIIERHGGIIDYRDGFSTTSTGVILAGKYDVRYGGYDSAYKFKRPAFSAKTVIYEGTRIARINSEIGDFIMENNGVYVYMLASLKTINERLKTRSNSKITKHVMKDYKSAYSIAMKYKDAGLRVIMLNTDELTTEQCYDKIKDYL
jgi:dephospho-CoA kinase